MKSSKPDISAPLSRSSKRRKKKSSGDGAAICILTLFGAVTLFAVCVVVAMVLDPSRSHGSTSTEDLEEEGEGSMLRSRQEGGEEDFDEEEQQFLVLTTPHGDIRIRLRPDLAPESVAHVQQLASKKCDNCQFYRSEKDLLLQGVMRSKDLLERPPKGQCPPEYQDEKQDCPPHDPNCACHGPTMTTGMVAWAGGGSGPDFFINVFETPVDWWGQQHTVWGIVDDPPSLDLIMTEILAMPVKNKGGMNMLDEPFDFEMKLEEEE